MLPKISLMMQQEINTPTNVAVGQFIRAQQYHELWLNQMQQGIRKETELTLSHSQNSSSLPG